MKVGDTVNIPHYSGATVVTVTKSRIKVQYYCARNGQVEMWVDRDPSNNNSYSKNRR